MGTARNVEKKIIWELTDLLRKNADSLLTGETKLCLTTSSLSVLAASLVRVSQLSADERTVQAVPQRHDMLDRSVADHELWKDNIRTLHNFFHKALALKIIHVSYTIRAPVQISRFASLQVLELKKVPVHMIEGLSKLRGQLREIIISRSLHKLQDVLEICGGDRSSGLTWQNLKSAYFSFNFIEKLDNSLRFAPFLEVLDISHNNVSRADDYLQNLTDLLRVNVGYNMLSAVPQFSYSNKGKLCTLVLRNNNLDNLAGIQELTSLKELDLTDNCLADHGCLATLSHLNRLSVLCLIGNPLSYKSDHRTITLDYVSALAGMGIFILDGRHLNAHELIIVKQTLYKTARDQTDSLGVLSLSSVESIGADHTDDDLSSSHNNSLQLPSSSHTRHRKHGHQRVFSKERIPKITNIEDTMQAQSASSNNNSPTGSYVEKADDIAAIEQEKERVAIMREHYKDDWLKALYANQEDQHPGESTGTQSTMEASGQRTVTAEITQGLAEIKDDVDQHLPTGVHDNDRILMLDEKPQHPATVATTSSSETTTDIYTSTLRSPTSPTPAAGDTNCETPAGYFKGARSTDQQYYGEESDPLIIMLPTEDMKQILITVNDRYILEKDLTGACRERVDLKCLQSVSHSEEMLSGPDIVWGVTFPVLTLKLDYVRRDMRVRRYAMEDVPSAHQLAELLARHVAARQQSTRAPLMECLKCKQQFVKPKLNHSEALCCPQCASKMVFDLTTQQAVADTSNVTEASREKRDVELTQKSSSPKPSPTLQRSSAVRKKNKVELSTEVQQNSQRSNVGSLLTVGKGGRMSEGFIVGDSLKETVDSLIPEIRFSEGAPPATDGNTQIQGLYVTDDETVESEPTVAGSRAAGVVLRDGNIQRTASTDQLRHSGHAHAMVKHRSWSDIPKSLDPVGGIMQNMSWSDMQKLPASSAMVSSISSVESDITVLATNSSRGSIAAISESSRELLLSGRNIGPAVLQGGVVVAASCVPGEVLDVSGGAGGRRDSCGHTTPAGSPLSSSVCSSMVSSVYETTLAAAGDNTGHDDASLNVSTSSEDSVTLRHKYPKINVQSQLQWQQTGDFQSDHVMVNNLHRKTEASLAPMDNVQKDCPERVSDDLSMQSIYYSVNSTDFQVGNTVSNDESNSESIYDSTNTDLSNKPNGDHSISDNSTDSSTDVSPLRRGNSSNKSFRNRHRKLYASEHEFEECSQTNTGLDVEVSTHNSTTGHIEPAHSSFPPHLSPIKRVSSHQSDHKHRSAIIVDSELQTDNNCLDVSQTSELSLDRDDTDVNESIGNVSHSTADMRLPWESDESISKEGSLSHEEFVNIDHRLQLYLELQVFQAVETCQCAIQSSIVQYMNMDAVSSYLVVSTSRILIFRIHGNPDTDNTSDWVKCIEDQPITELQFVDIGLGYQSLRLEFGTECSSYTLVIADEGRCKRILTLLTEILQTVSLSGHSKLQGVSKSVPGTMVNLEAEVLCETGDQEPQEFVKYLMATITDYQGESSRLLGVVVTCSDVVLVDENHQWPLPRLQAPLGNLKGKQFTVQQREKINTIETLEFNEYNPCELRVSFFNEGSDEKLIWLLTMASTHGVKSLVDAIRTPWEDVFGVSLDITPVSFSD